MIYFGIPLRSKAVSKNWEQVQKVFNRTLQSIYNQTDSNFKVFVACHDIPELTIKTDERLEFLVADSPYPKDRYEMMLDKGWKISMIAMRIRELGGGYTMLVDSDDLVSNRIAEYVNAHPGENGFLSKYGYMYNEGFSYVKRVLALHRICGSCAIVNYSVDDLPDSMPENLWDDTPREKWIIRKPHREVPKYLSSIGRPLQTIPFPTTMYLRNTGDNHSMLNGADIVWKRKVELFFRRKLSVKGALGREFGLSRAKFAIRDDDVSYFTSPEELEKAYDFMPDGCVSLSIVPFTVAQHTDKSKPYGERSETGTFSLGDNPELTEYLKQKLASGSVDAVLHGVTHEYKKTDGDWTPEMLWKDAERLSREVKEAKQYLEEQLGRSISVFAAPSNKIGKAGIAALEENNLQFCGVIHSFSSRPFSLRMLANYAKRWLVRVFCGIQYPGLMNYGKHRELNAYPLNDDKMLDKEYEYCRKRNIPFVVYTHYWKLNQDAEEKRKLERIYRKLKADGAEAVPLSSLFDDSVLSTTHHLKVMGL